MITVVEIGMKLNKSLIYYHKKLIENGFQLIYSCNTRDVYYTKQNLNGLTEKEMKDACERIRYCHVLNKEIKSYDDLKEKENNLIQNGYSVQFDTTKFDYHYSNSIIKGRIQIQDIENLGLLVYYDNPDYYEYPLLEQRRLLLNELNSYGFDFKEKELGLDKLRTLYYKEEKYSLNQNA